MIVHVIDCNPLVRCHRYKHTVQWHKCLTHDWFDPHQYSVHSLIGCQINPSWWTNWAIFSFQPVLHTCCNKRHGVCYPICGMVHMKYSMLLIRKWQQRVSSLTIWMVLYHMSDAKWPCVECIVKSSSYRIHFTSTRFCSASAEHISLHYHCMLPGQQMYMVLVLRGISTSVP